MLFRGAGVSDHVVVKEIKVNPTGIDEDNP